MLNNELVKTAVLFGKILDFLIASVGTKRCSAEQWKDPFVLRLGADRRGSISLIQLFFIHFPPRERGEQAETRPPAAEIRFNSDKKVNIFGMKRNLRSNR